MRTALVIVALTLSAGSTAVGAQAGASASTPDTALAAATASPEPRAFCRRGQRAHRCRAFLVFEMGYFRALSNTSYQVFEGMPDQITEGFGDHLSWELGAMRNVGERSALGGTLLIGFGEPDFRDAVKGRYRHWLTATRSLEASAGMLRTSVGTWRTTPGVGVTADVQVNFADRVALTVRVDQLRTKDFGTARAVYGGATLGSRPALAGTGTLLLVGGLMVLLFVASEGGS